MDRKTRQRKWNQYCRTLIPPTEKSGSAEKVPDEYLLKMVGAHEKTYFFNLWVSKGDCSWAKVVAYEEHVRIEAAENEQEYEWLTESQLGKVYNDPEIATEIKNSKYGQKGFWRPHPELPDNVKAVQFKCLVKDAERKKHIEMVKQKFVSEMELEGDQAVMAMRAVAGRSASSIGSSSSSSAMPTAQSEVRDSAVHETKAEAVERGRSDLEERARKQALARAERDRLSALPENRLSAWLTGVSAHINKCTEAAQKARSDENKGMIPSVAREYAATFDSKAVSLKKLRTQLEKCKNGEKADNLGTEVAKAEKTCKDLKSELRTFENY